MLFHLHERPLSCSLMRYADYEAANTGREIVGLGQSRDFLTEREYEIVNLIARGLSAKQIARALGIAPCTIQHHVANVRMKTGTRNRAHMVAHVLRSGLL